MKFTSVLSTLALVGSTVAAPARSVLKRGFDCTAPVAGLSVDDCNWLSQIGFLEQGLNPTTDPGTGLWIGNGGPNSFVISNTGGQPMSVIVWIQMAGDFQASFPNARQMQVTYSLPTQNSTVTISMQNGISGALSFVQTGVTALSQFGQVGNTWGEFTSGTGATFDVSREVEMNGLPMSSRTPVGCVSDMNTCVFQCPAGQESCETGYSLVNCDNGSQPGASSGTFDGAPSGGCQGWENGGVVTINLG